MGIFFDYYESRNLMADVVESLVFIGTLLLPSKSECLEQNAMEILLEPDC